ncbi:MAG: hypothetical protein IT258_20450 [Saprospiraceae bacterium]|nr:hypothetical protein [Saprospiraceae bacterium]
MEDLVPNIKQVEIIGVLDHIQKANYMIFLHRLRNEESMIKQFERQREDYLEQLKKLLAELSIKATLKEAA